MLEGSSPLGTHTQVTEHKFKHTWWDRSKNTRTALTKTDPHCYCWRNRQASLAPTSIPKIFSARAGRWLQTSPTDWFVLRLFARASILWKGYLSAICHANFNCPLVLKLIFNYMLLIYYSWNHRSFLSVKNISGLHASFWYNAWSS